jgi:hypothetical protein
VNFAVSFSEDVSGFDANDVTLGGSANPSTVVVSGGPSIYNLAVSGMTADGSVTASIAAGAANSVDDGTASEASTSTDDSVIYDATAPAAVIDLAPGQDNPASTSPINFSVVFSEPVSDFESADVTIGGTAGPTTALVTGSGTSYNVAVSGMTGDGTVTASVNAGAAADAAGNPSTASSESVVNFDGATPVALSVTGIDPAIVNRCSCTYPIEVAGTGFAPGVTVTFSGGSGPTPAASAIDVNQEGTSLTATLTLKSAGPRRASVWDVIVTLPDGTSAVLEDALTVTP